MTAKKLNAQQLLQSARLAEIADRYDDMKDFMRQLVAEKKGDINSSERDLLSIGYKHSVGALRGAYRSINVLATKKPADDVDTGVVDNYRKSIQKKLSDICSELLELLDTHLLPNATENDAKIYFLKMVGDYARYMAEGKEVDSDLDQMVEKSRSSYQQALDLASQKMGPIDPTRLGLALNFSVFYYEIVGAPDKAIQLAKQAYDEAVAQMDKMSDSDHKDTVLITQLLRENLALWNVKDIMSNGEMPAEQAVNGTTGEAKIDSTPAKSPEEAKKVDPSPAKSKSPEEAKKAAPLLVVDTAISSSKRSKSPAPEKVLKSPEAEKILKQHETMELGDASEQQQKDEKAPAIPKEASPKPME